MAQHDYTIANQTFPNTRSDLNNSLSAIVSNNSGATEPSTTYAYQWWYDETTDTLKMRNSDNDAWISMFTFNQTADTYSATISGDLTVDTDTLKVDSANNRVGIGLTNPACQLDIREDGTGSLTKRVQANIDLSGSTNLLSTDPNLFVQQSGTGSAGLALKSGAVEFALRLDSSGEFIFDKETTERMRIDSSGNVGIGTNNPSRLLDVDGSIGASGSVNSDNGTTHTNIGIAGTGEGIVGTASNHDLQIRTNGSEKMRVKSNGALLINTFTESLSGGINYKDASGSGSANEKGFGVDGNSIVFEQTSSTTNHVFNDSSSGAGTHAYIGFRFQGSTIGSVDTLNNSTVRYNTFTGGHWSQFHDGTNPELKTGTVMSLIGDKLEYSKCEKTITREETVTNEDGTEEVQTREEVQKFEIAGTHEIGTEVTVPNDEYGEEDSTTTATVVSNYNVEHLVKVKVSDSIADKAVYGIWAGKYSDGDLSVEALGASKIRIKQGEVLEIGDLLESAGDGTAQKQSDDIIKNSTIAKVTSPTVIETFDDNSFLVSCVLYCG